MRILLINHYAGSARYGMEYRPYYLSREWIRLDHTVRIVAASQSHVRSVQPRVGDIPQRELIDGIEYSWYPTPPYRGNGIRRVLNMAAFVRGLWRHADSVADEFRPDIVIASSTYPMDIWPAQRIARRAGAQLVFEVHDLWPLSPIELGGMSRWHPFIQVVALAEAHAYRRSDLVISMLPKAQDYMISRGMPREAFCHVPNGIDPHEWSNAARLPAIVVDTLNAVRSKGRLVVAYAGAHGLANALDVFLDSAKSLENIAELVLVGDGPEKTRLAARVRSEELRNVTMIDSIPKRSIPAFLEAIDVAYIGLQSQPLFRFGISPNKLMDYMMAGKPIVMAIAAGNDPVHEANCGLTVPPNDPAAIANAVTELAAKTPLERERLGSNGRQYVLSHCTYGVLAKQFLDACLAGRKQYAR